MADTAPDAYVNPTDSLATTDAYRAFATWLDWLTINNARFHYEKIARGYDPMFSTNWAGDNRASSPHAHGEVTTSPGCGEVVRRSLISKVYTAGSAVGSYTVALNTSDWIELDRYRSDTGGFKAVATEIYYTNSQPDGGNQVLFKIENRDARDSGAAGSVNDELIETVGTAHATVQWHTVDEGGGGTGKDLLISGPTNYNDPGDTTSRREFILYAKATNGASGCSIGVEAVHIWEILRADL